MEKQKFHFYGNENNKKNLFLKNNYRKTRNYNILPQFFSCYIKTTIYTPRNDKQN